VTTVEETNVKAFLLIQTASASGPIGSSLRTLPGVEFELTDDVTGPFDAIALVNAGSTRDLLDSVVGAIRGLPGVTHVLSAPVAGSLITLAPEPAAA
jgi:hypothetical protein